MKANKKILTMIIGALMVGSIAVGCQSKEQQKEEIKQEVQQEVKEFLSKKETENEKFEIVAYDKNDIKITCIEIIKTEQAGMKLTTMKFKIENGRDEAITVQNDMEVKINDITVNNTIVEDLEANETKEAEMVFVDDTDFKENSIENIEKFETNLMILHDEYTILDEEVLTFNISE